MAVNSFPGNCGVKIYSQIMKQMDPVSRTFSCQIPTFPLKGLILATLNENQIRDGLEEVLLQAGFKILIDGFRNINMGNSYCTLYALIQDPKDIRSRFDSKSPEWKKKLPKDLQYFFRHTQPKKDTEPKTKKTR